MSELIEVELHSYEPQAIDAVRATMRGLPGGDLIERDGRFFVPAGFPAFAAERHPAHRLTEADVRAIRERVAAGTKYGDLAAELGVTRSLIGQIARRTAWRHVA